MKSPLALPFGTRIVTAAFLTQGLAIGLPMSAYPVFIESLESELGATRTQTSMGISMIIVAGALIGPRVGRAIDAGWAKTVMGVGVLLFALGFWGLSWAPSLLVATLIWIGVVGPGYAMIGPHPAMTVLARWFVVRRGRMIAIAAMGTTVGAALAPTLAQILIDDFGWRAALVGFGLVAAAIGLPAVFFGIFDSPEAIGAHPDGASAPPPQEAHGAGTGTPSESIGVFFRDPRFWLIAIGFGLMMGSSIGYITHVVEWAGESGLERDAAVRLIVVNALFASAGKLLFGWLSDRLGARGASLIAVALQLAGWSSMLVANATWTFTAGAALYGLGLGCIIPCQAGYIGSIWGRARFGRAAGLMGLIAISGPFVIPVSVGIAFDRLGSYEWAMAAMWVVIALPALTLGLSRPSPAR